MRSGSLAQGVLPRLLRTFYVGRKSGTLELAREAERHTLRFSQGQLVGAEGNVEALSLGRQLTERGLATPEDLRQASETAQRETKPLARVLAEVGTIDRARLEEARIAQLRTVVQRLQGWTAGTYSLEETDGQLAEDLIAGLAMGDLILESVQAITDADVARFALGDLDRVLAPSPDPLLRFQKITLKPTEGYLLSRVDGILSAREVSQLVPAPAEEIALCLYGLYCAGLVEFLETKSKNLHSGISPRRAAHARSAGASPAPASRAPDTPGPPQAAPATPPTPAAKRAPSTAPASAPGTSPNKPAASGPAAASAAPDKPQPQAAKPESEEKRRQEVLDLYRELGSRNHFEVLGLTRSANEVQVKEAYFALARRFHPDVFRGQAFADVAEQVAAVFIRLGEAYEVLKDPAQRGRYEARMPRLPTASSGATGAPTGTPTVVEGPASGPDLEVESRLAEEALRKGEKLLAGEQYWDAIQQVEPNLEKLKGKLRARGRMVLARCYLKNPNWSRRAEEQLRQLVVEEPKYAEAHYQLGLIYLAGGLRTRALSEFRKTVELNSLHEEAKAKVAELEPPPEETPPQGGGFLGRLFGRGN